MEALAKLPEPVMWGILGMIGLVLWGVMNGKIKFKKNKDGSFQLGDDTPFEKTNARFKKLCSEISEVNNNINNTIVPMITGLNLSVLKLTVTDEQLSPQERLNAFDQYKKFGGNGWLDLYVEEHVKPLLKKSIQPSKTVA